MSKRLNVTEIKNDLEGSAFFPSRENRIVEKLPATPPLQLVQQKIPTTDEKAKPLQKKCPHARKPECWHSSKTESQYSGNLEVQQNTTATEKVTYRFHPEGKYAIEDIKTVLARKYGIKASYELI